jgi:hypothetical protein
LTISTFSGSKLVTVEPSGNTYVFWNFSYCQLCTFCPIFIINLDDLINLIAVTSYTATNAKSYGVPVHLNLPILAAIDPSIKATNEIFLFLFCLFHAL